MMTKYNEKFLERFWSKVSKGGPDECWMWIGSNNAYGRIHFEYKILEAHRVSWEIHKGPIPEGMFILHSCDKRSCVNPEHLFLGMQLNNIRDCITKGRNSRGEKNKSSKLTEKAVLEIRASCVPYAILAERYHVSKSTISFAKRYVTWKHVK